MIVSASLTNYDLLTPPRFIGVENFERLFTRERLFPVSLYNTAYYTFLALPFQTLIVLGQALLLNMKVKGVNHLSHALLSTLRDTDCGDGHSLDLHSKQELWGAPLGAVGRGYPACRLAI